MTFATTRTVLWALNTLSVQFCWGSSQVLKFIVIYYIVKLICVNFYDFVDLE